MIHSYTRENSNVRCTLINLTKGFDQMNFNALISKLLMTQTPFLITKMLCFIIINSFVNVNFNRDIGDKWKVSSGAQQGGI